MNVAVALLCLAVMCIALSGAVPLPRAPWVWHVIAAVLALLAALTAFGVLAW